MGFDEETHATAVAGVDVTQGHKYGLGEELQPTAMADWPNFNG
jgi:hypothetical protein